jgi:hypothetical protein
MNALTKFSIALLLVTGTAVAVYLYATPGDEGFDVARSELRDTICKQDGKRLARLRARPSLDEGQTLLDSLSDPSRWSASSKLA